MRTTGACNQKELVGILREVASLNVRQPLSRQLTVEAARFVLRLNLNTVNADEIGILSGFWDELLTQLWLGKRRATALPEWWRQWGEFTRLLGCHASFQAVVNEEHSWLTVEMHVNVASQTKLGSKMFAHASQRTLRRRNSARRSLMRWIRL